MNKIYISKAEVKHTNSKALITIYSFNREKISLLKKMNNLKKNILRKLAYLRYLKNNKKKFRLKKKYLKIKKVYLAYKKLFSNLSRFNILGRQLFLKSLFSQELSLFRRYKLRFNLNKYKFEEKLLYLLSSLISKYYNKKVEFNIVNMKSIILNSDIFTYILTLKLKNKKANIIRMMNIILNRAALPNVNRILEKSPVIKSVDLNLLENKFKNTNINSALSTKDSLDKILNKLYTSKFDLDLEASSSLHKLESEFHTDGGGAAVGRSRPHKNLSLDLDKFYNKIYEIIFNSIKYKNMGGVRLEVSGRLTKRYRADRALYKVK